MADKQLNVAVVGCGIFGELHVATYAAFERSNLVAICDINEQRARELGGKFGCTWCTDVQEIAADDSIEAVSVATPDFAHREVAEALARAGKHLLIEKPLATSVEDAEAIAGAVQAPDFVREVSRLAAGNPFFAGEVMRTLVAEGELDVEAGLPAARLPLPSSVRDTIGRRITSLPEATPACSAIHPA